MNKGLSEELKPRRGGRSFFYWARRASPGGARGAQALPYPEGLRKKNPALLRRAFPNNIGVARPLVPDYIIPDPQ
jgi:hypothetical protein